VTSASDIYSLGVVAYECLAGRPPFTASEPLAIAFAHKHDPVPPLPPDVPQSVADLVYDMLAKTPDGRPASMRVVADRAEMLRDALAMGDAMSDGRMGVTRADLPAARTSSLGQDAGRNRPGGRGAPNSRRGLAVAGLTLALCGLAAAAGLYISGHLASQNTGDTGNNTTAQHLSPTPTAPSPTAAQSTTPSPQPSSLGPNQTTTAPSPTVSPRPTKTIRPSPSKTASPSSSPSPSASPSPTPTPTPTSSPSPTATATATATQ
jgi:cell division septation protein DedD